MNTNSNKQTRRLTESQFQEHVAYLVAETLIREGFINEADMDEGFWNQMKQGAKSFFGNGYRKDGDFRNSVADRQARGEHTANWLNGSTPMNFKQRWNAAKTGYKQQGHIDNANQLRNMLDNLERLLGSTFDQATLNKMTIGQLKSRLGQSKASAVSRVSNANNAIYKGQQTGVMGSGRVATV